MAGRLLGEEEPVFVVNLREEGKIVSIAPDAHPARAGEFALAAAAEAVGMTRHGVIRDIPRG